MRPECDGGAPAQENAPASHHRDVGGTHGTGYPAPSSSDRSDAYPEMTSAERFERFHNRNPHVYDLLVKYCREWVDAGHVRFGIRAPWERMRWHLGIHTDSADFKLNDHMTAYYSRLISAREFDLAELLVQRRSDDADEWIALRLCDQAAAECELAADGGLFDFGLPEQGGSR